MRYDFPAFSMGDEDYREISIGAVLPSSALWNSSHRQRLPREYLHLCDLRGVGDQIVVKASCDISAFAAVERYADVFSGERIEAPYLLSGTKLSYDLGKLSRDAKRLPSSRLVSLLADRSEMGAEEGLTIERERLTFGKLMRQDRRACYTEALVTTSDRRHGLFYRSNPDDGATVELFCEDLDDPRDLEAAIALTPERMNDRRVGYAFASARKCLLDAIPYRPA